MRRKKDLVVLFMALIVMTSVFAVLQNVPLKPSTQQKVVYNYHIMTGKDIESLKEKIGVRNPKKNYNILIDGHGTGLAPPTEREYESWIGHIKYVDSVEGYKSKGSVDLSQSNYFPPVGDQGQQGSCASWTSAYYNNGYHQAYIHNWTDTHTGNNQHHLMSPSWVYNKINNGSDGGSDLTGPYKVMKNDGDASLATMPYNDQDYTSWGDESAWREAPIGRIQDFEVTSVTSIDVIKSWIDQGDSLMSFAINANCYDSAFSDGNYIISWQEYQSYQGSPNHGQTIVGYDDSVSDDGDVGAFKVVNSWGSSWGDNGFYWITYNAFQHLAWNQVIRITGDTPNNPHLLAVWQFSSPGARDASVRIGIGTPSNPVNYRDGYFYGGTSNFPTFMALDMSDFENDFNNGNHDFFLCIGEQNAGSSSSTISSYKVEYYENGYDPGNPTQVSDESPDVPATSPCCVTNTLNIGPLSIGITNPKAGGIYRGGSTINIEWTIHSDSYASNQITVKLYYSYSGSGGWQLIDTVSGDQTPYPWTLPTVDVNDFDIKANATDPSSNTSEHDSGYFTVDSTPPTLTDTYPANGAQHVSTNLSAIWLNFSEEVNITSLQNSLNITPQVDYTISDQGSGHVKLVIGKTTGNPQEGTTPASTYGDYIDAQLFKMPEAGNISSVDIYMLKEGTPPADCRLQIVELGANGEPNGNLLGETSVSQDMVGTSFSWITFTFATPVHLNANVQYALVLNMSGVGDSSNRYRWGVGSDVYSDGDFWQYQGSNGWVEFSQYDGSFIIHYGQGLKNNTCYTVTVGSGVTDIAGNPMGSDHKSTFCTGAAVPEFSAMLPMLVILLAIIGVFFRRK